MVCQVIGKIYCGLVELRNDLFAQAIIQIIFDNPDEKLNIKKLIIKIMKDKVRDLEIAISGDVTPEQTEKIRIIKEHYDVLAICKEDLETMIWKLSQEYQEQVKMIQIVPRFSVL